MHGDLISRAMDYAKTQHVLVLAGGPSPENEDSGAMAMALAAQADKICASVRTLNVEGARLNPDDFIDINFVLNTMYGYFGEDGTVRGFLDALEIRSSGSSILASAIGMNKQICSFLVSEWGHTVPVGCLASDLTKMGSPAWSQFEGTSRFIAKPIHGGDSFGIQVFDDTALLIHAIQTMNKRQQLETRIEAFIDGAIGTIGLLSVGGELLIGDCIRIDLPEGKQFYDTSLKWGLGEPVKRAGFDAPMEEHITTSATDIYERLGCSSLARIDFIVSGGLLYFLEVNTNPGLYVGSNADLSFRNEFEFQQLLALIILAGSDAANNRQGYR